MLQRAGIRTARQGGAEKAGGVVREEEGGRVLVSGEGVRERGKVGG